MTSRKDQLIASARIAEVISNVIVFLILMFLVGFIVFASSAICYGLGQLIRAAVEGHVIEATRDLIVT